jgi:hypothetical protein
VFFKYRRNVPLALKQNWCFISGGKDVAWFASSVFSSMLIGHTIVDLLRAGRDIRTIHWWLQERVHWLLLIEVNEWVTIYYTSQSCLIHEVAPKQVYSFFYGTAFIRWTISLAATRWSIVSGSATGQSWKTGGNTVVPTRRGVYISPQREWCKNKYDPYNWGNSPLEDGILPPVPNLTQTASISHL